MVIKIESKDEAVAFVDSSEVYFERPDDDQISIVFLWGQVYKKYTLTCTLHDADSIYATLTDSQANKIITLNKRWVKGSTSKYLCDLLKSQF